MAQIETNLQDTVKRFESMQISGRELEKTLHKLVSNVIKEVRNRMIEDAKGVIGTGYKHSGGDPRQAYRAIKRMVYKRVLGGNVSILQKPRGSVKKVPVPDQKFKLKTALNSKGNHRGGNRIKRSQRSEDLMSYWGTDRGFILRFLNSGTDTRQSRIGNRGSISARNWFPSAGLEEMKAASEQLAQLIEQEIEKFNNK